MAGHALNVFPASTHCTRLLDHKLSQLDKLRLHQKQTVVLWLLMDWQLTDITIDCIGLYTVQFD